MEPFLIYLAPNKPSLVQSIKTIPGISDQDILVIDTDTKARICKKPCRKVYRWKRADWDTMKEATSEFSTSFTESSQGSFIDENYTAIDEHLQRVLNDHVPSTYTRTRKGSAKESYDSTTGHARQASLST